MIRNPAFLIPAVLLCSAGAAFAAPQRELLLVVQGSELLVGPPLPPEPPYEIAPRVLVFRDGGLIEVEAGSPGPQTPADGSMLLGQIPAADLSALTTALRAASIGRQGDCTGAFDADLLQGQIALTWFGVRGGTHTILVSYNNGPGSPPCSELMENVLLALGHARFVVEHDPATVVVGVPTVP
jgi:hypothetical protein